MLTCDSFGWKKVDQTSCKLHANFAATSYELHKLRKFICICTLTSVNLRRTKLSNLKPTINSPLPKRHKRITRSHHSNIGAKRSTKRNCPNFIWTTPQLRTNFASTSYELRLHFVRNSPQLHTNFASTSYELCLDFVRTSPWLRKNYCTTSYELRANFTKNELRAKFVKN